MAIQKACRAFQVEVSARASPGIDDKDGGTTQDAAEAFPAVVDAGPPTRKICNKEEAPVTTQKAVEMSPATVDTGSPPGRADKKRVTAVAA